MSTESRSVSTNVGPRQGPSQDRDVSQIFESGTGSYTLPAVGDLKRSVNVDVKKKLLRKVIYKKLCSKMESAGFSYELDLDEQGLTQLEESAVTRTSTITTVVRSVSKGIDYLTWYSVEKGWDAAGQEVIGSGTYLPHGLDKDVEIKQIKNSEGVTTKLQLSNTTKDILTEEFTPDKLEQLLNNSVLDDRIQFSFTNNLGKSFGGFSAEELIHCSAAELSSRGQLAKAGEDLTVMYSELSAKDKLFLQTQAPK